MKVVVGKLDQQPLSGNRKPSTVTQRKVRDETGKQTTIRMIDARSDTFGSDLLWVFRQNVAKARKENKRVTGSADGRPDKR